MTIVFAAIIKEKGAYCFRELFFLPPGLVPTHTFNPTIRIVEYVRMFLNIAFDASNDFCDTDLIIIVVIRIGSNYLEQRPNLPVVTASSNHFQEHGHEHLEINYKVILAGRFEAIPVNPGTMMSVEST